MYVKAVPSDLKPLHCMQRAEPVGGRRSTSPCRAKTASLSSVPRPSQRTKKPPLPPTATEVRSTNVDRHLIQCTCVLNTPWCVAACVGIRNPLLGPELGKDTRGIPQAFNFRWSVLTDIPSVLAACVRFPWCCTRACSTAARSRSSSEVPGGISMRDLLDDFIGPLPLPAAFDSACE